MTYRAVFMGSPDFAVPTLNALIEAPDFTVVGVVTQPDRPAGRGGKLRQTPVKETALAHNIPVFQPEKLRGEAALEQLRAWQPDVTAVAAYGQILKPEFLDLPPYGSINVHASLLPRWRGAAPIHAAVRAGDDISGITIMKMDPGLDTGPMLMGETVALDPRETVGTLHDKLAIIAGPLLLRALRAYFSGEILPQSQDDALATYAPQIEKEDGQIDWTRPAIEIDRHVRAFDPFPGTYTFWGERRLKILAGMPLQGTLEPGKIRRGEGQHPFLIGTGAGTYAPSSLQLEGKKQVGAADFLNGNPDLLNARLA